MRLNSTKLTLFLSLTFVLLLVPLYTVQAEGKPLNTASKSATLRQDIRSIIQQRDDDRKALFETQLAQFKDKIASREAEFRLRLNKFKDQTKAIIAQRVNQNLNMINQNQTSAMGKNLDTITSILDRVTTQVGGTSTTSAQVAAAKSAIDSSRIVVNNQALKDYTITVSTESAIRRDAQSMRDKLHTDLKTTRDTVQAAKQAAILAVRSLLGVKEGSKSATQSGISVN